MIIEAPKRRTELCQAETGASIVRADAICKIELDNGKAPEWCMLFPASDVDGEIKARDGRKFRMVSAERFCADYNAESHEVPFDIEHATEILAPMGQPAPAVGWVVALEARDGAVWGRVEWTTDGAELIESKKYRYVSPAFRIDRETAKILTLTSAGLTNRPALKMPALTHEQNGDNMHPELLKLLGLEEKSTKEQVLAAAEVMKAKADKAEKVETELASERAKAPALKDFVPRADYDAALARVSAFEKKIEEDKQLAHKAAVDAEIEAAMKAGKIAPATKDFYVKTCSTAEGLEQFREFVKVSPTIAPDNAGSGAKPKTETASDITELDIKVALACGMTRADLEKGTK